MKLKVATIANCLIMASSNYRDEYSINRVRSGSNEIVAKVEALCKGTIITS